jgi:hypothetical protein
VLFLLTINIALSFGAGPITAILSATAEQLLDPQQYGAAVLALSADPAGGVQ